MGAGHGSTPRWKPGEGGIEAGTRRSPRELRKWLERNDRQAASVWLVTGKKSSPHYLPTDSVVDELLCFGWIDSVPRKLDERRTMLLISPRKPGSSWSAVNKARIERLMAAGRMKEAGLARIAEAQADGSWDRLATVDALLIPLDLETALASEPVAAGNFAAFPPSSRRGILEWIGNAKTPETRRRRVAETVAKAARNVKANYPEGRNAGPGGIVVQQRPGDAPAAEGDGPGIVGRGSASSGRTPS
jgi:uncharacterized protein YdeI (YjbR/CyaY-like superfamily)